MQAKSTVKKVHSLIDKVYHLTNLKLAWKKVKSNRGSGGIDKTSIKDFTNVAAEELQKPHQQLKEATYEPMPARRVYSQREENQIRRDLWGFLLYETEYANRH